MVVAAIALIVGGMRPWQDSGYFYSLMAISLSVFVVATVGGEFWRGGRVIARQQHVSVAAGILQITRRNTRRYGGYLVHLGVVLVIIGFAGLPFNQDKEQEMGFGDKMQIAGYTLVCQSYTQDDKPNYESEWAVLDVYKNGKKLDTMFPERRFYKASEQTATIVANRSRLNEDLYIVYTGRNPDTGKPIIKAHVNPLVMWIWIGVHLLLIGTIIAMLPSTRPAKYAVSAKEREAAEAVKQGAVGVGGD
jgi:cytochrome c-type biogenesis protein CcmF